MKAAPDGIHVILGAMKQPGYSQFRQSNRFFYLTGLEEPSAAIVLVPERKQQILFLSPTPELYVRWEGAGLRPGKDVEAKYLFNASRLYEDLPSVLNELIRDRKVRLYVPFAPEEIGRAITDSIRPVLRQRRADPLDGRPSREENFVEKLGVMFPTAEVKDLSPRIREMRTHKSKREASLMREAARVSAAGWAEVLSGTRAGMFEYQLGALMEARCRMLGGSGWPYWPIIGSGDNANVMHYVRNSKRLADGELVLMDAAYGFGYYACDITRTFPVSGRFTPEQRKIYQDLLDVQKAIVAQVKPGVSLSELNARSVKMLVERGYDRKKHIVHFLGHFIGMAVHDPGSARTPLEPGVVFTVEPGLYFPEKKMGFRIEDVVLVTKTGGENLTAAVPKEVAEIEAIMAKGRKKRKK
jgi:Xaa-Pro aminopeptidase